MQFLLGYDLWGNKYSVGELWRDCSYDFKKSLLTKNISSFLYGWSQLYATNEIWDYSDYLGRQYCR